MNILSAFGTFRQENAGRVRGARAPGEGALIPAIREHVADFFFWHHVRRISNTTHFYLLINQSGIENLPFECGLLFKKFFLIKGPKTHLYTGRLILHQRNVI